MLSIYSLQSVQSFAPSVYSSQSARSKSSFATPLPLSSDIPELPEEPSPDDIPDNVTVDVEQASGPRNSSGIQAQQPDDTSTSENSQNSPAENEAVQPHSGESQSPPTTPAQQPDDRSSSLSGPLSRLRRLFSQPSSALTRSSIDADQPNDNSASL